MLFSYAEKSTPFVLSPESLDWHLAKGWYRMGSTIFTTHFLFFQNRPFSAIWIRIDLQNFKFSRSQRKLLRKNAQLFDTAIAPRCIDEERERLYRKYADSFDGRLSPSVADSLEDYDNEVLFNTWEVTVRDRVRQQLVASSYFDLGGRSAASILGIFDPDLKSFSLGYYTMLLEIEHCLQQGFRYYYPGYVVPGYQRFDYKLRLGKAEYFDIRTEGWLPYNEFNPDAEAPVEAQQLALARFTEVYGRQDAGVRVKIYPLFEAGLYDIWNDDYFPYPYLVSLGGQSRHPLIVVAFDPKVRQYYLLECRHMIQTQLMFNAEYLQSFESNDFVTELLAVRQVLLQTADVHHVAEACVALNLG
ncbi:arginine-tRNA-protein transferase [Lewinella marina]|uniref:Arginine-tRNA-protein transferase n=1 Tax=Neolewinella marina TaxID=438751 RepID=A0A2G0CFC8_9BACT|nr:GNAT family N-acetyltransferase [Neolewinella marina]NJB85632.1 arginine-tRNA-protein transferase [Neolewinella marina]PHK98683.1 arginine-tRNA-protein transferase [Neolewinella marina]